MNLSKLVHRVWKNERVQETKINKSDVRIIVNVMVDEIVKALLEHKKLKMQGLFTLKIRTAKGRKIKNPRTHETMEINDYLKVGIEPSKALRDGLKKLKQKEDGNA